MFNTGIPRRYVCFFKEKKMVTINGESINAAGKTVAQYIAEAGYNPERIVVERNLVILKKDELASTVIQDGDSIEILNFVGGG